MKSTLSVQSFGKLVLIVICLGCFVLASYWFGVLIGQGVLFCRRIATERRFTRIAKRLELYHQNTGAFPPTKYQPEAGGAVHSWRVLLATDFDRDPSATEYDFSQEWNSPQNLKVLYNHRHSVPFSLFRHCDRGIAHYLAIGEDGEWPRVHFELSKDGKRYRKYYRLPLRSLLITSGEDRFLLVEDPDSDIFWMEPRF